jgi:hypothetical protein
MVVIPPVGKSGTAAVNTTTLMTTSTAAAAKTLANTTTTIATTRTLMAAMAAMVAMVAMAIPMAMVMAAMQFAFFSTLNVSSASICTVLFFLAAYLLALSSSECQGIGWGARASPFFRRCVSSVVCRIPPPLSLSLFLSLLGILYYVILT